MKKKIFIVIGILGHVGSTLARLLSSYNLEIRGFALPSDDESCLNGLNDIKIIRGDITNAQSLDELFIHSDDEELYVIHAAGIISIYKEYSELMYKVNVVGTKNVVEKCIEFNVRKLVYISSVHAIIPSSEDSIRETSVFNQNFVKGAYSKTKAEATKIVLDSKDKLDVSIVHPSGIIGPYDNGHNHLTGLIKSIISGKLRVGVKGAYDFVDVRDVAYGCYQALMLGQRGECYILSNQSFTIKELFNIITDVSKQKPIKFYFSLPFAKMFAWICEIYYKVNKKHPLFTRYSLFTLGEKVIFSHEKADKELNYKVRPMEDTIKDTIEWMDKNNLLKKKVVKMKYCKGV